MKPMVVLMVVVSMLAVCSAPAAALPLPLPTPGAPPTAGETDLVPLFIGNVNVDWMVIPHLGGYRYFFQVENLSSTLVTAFTIFAGTLSLVTNAGGLLGDNLDLATAAHAQGHNSASFPGLAGEEEPTVLSFPALPPIVTSGVGFVSWTFPSLLLPGAQSNALFFDAPTPPTYGSGTLAGFSPAAGGPVFWMTSPTNPQEELPVPSAQVPVPEPSALFLVGVGLIGAGVWGRRHLKAAFRRR